MDVCGVHDAKDLDSGRHAIEQRCSGKVLIELQRLQLEQLRCKFVNQTCRIQVAVVALMYAKAIGEDGQMLQADEGQDATLEFVCRDVATGVVPAKVDGYASETVARCR